MSILRKIYLFLIDTVQTIVIAAVIFVLTYIFLFRPFQVSGNSMYPTYKDHEYILTNIIGLRVGNVHRGDVIVFRAPPDKERDFIKRVIGLPGETISLQEGFVYINGKKLDESKYLDAAVRTYGGAFLKDGSFIQRSFIACLLASQQHTTHPQSFLKLILPGNRRFLLQFRLFSKDHP